MGGSGLNYILVCLCTSVCLSTGSPDEANYYIEETAMSNSIIIHNTHHKYIYIYLRMLF